MKLKGVIFPGVSRGANYIEIFFDRIRGLIGFVPYKGTLNVKLEKQIDFKLFDTKRIEHVLLDGTTRVDARLAPIKLHIKKENIDVEYDCWAIREERGIYEKDILEILAKDNIKQKFSLKDGDEVDVELFEREKKSIMTKMKASFRRIFKPEKRLHV